MSPDSDRFSTIRLEGNTLVYYRPPKELWEGDVFIPVCPSVSDSVHGGPHVTITRDTLKLTVH